MNYVLEHFEKAPDMIEEIAAHKIKNKMIVFTHCHSSTVRDALIRAKKQGINFEVHNTETRPVFQGRITAKELAKAGIPVTHYVDSAARLALKKSDLMLLGADAITADGKVINKIGSELIGEVADRYDIPIYICTDSWKFDPRTIFGKETEIEERPAKEIWSGAPKKVKIANYAFEKINPDIITGIITELGIYRPAILLEEIKKAYPWMFKL
jgi:ribose 1,5-bisphosphate isomerase